MQPFLRRILYADDDEGSTELMELWLEQNWYEVKIAKTKNEILRLAEQEPFDLYLLDDWFPDGRGKDLIPQLQHLDPHTPIIFLSADVRATNQAEILRLGAQAFMPKPIDLDQVLAIIAQIICAAEQERGVAWPGPHSQISRNNEACVA